MKNQRYVIAWLFLCLATFACTDLADVETLGNRLSETENTDEMIILADELKSRGKKGISGLLHALSNVSEQDRWKVVEYGRINVCIKTLHEMATTGIYTEEAVPILIRTIELQISMPDTFVTAEILRIITGVDPGYTREYVDSYSGSETDEKSRLEKVEIWKQWWHENRGKAHGS